METSDHITLYQRRRWKTGLNITLIGSVLGALYPVFADGFGHWLPFVNGTTIGFLGGAAMAYFELVVFDPANRRIGFLALHSLKVITYLVFFTLLVFFIRGFNESLFLGLGFIEYIRSDPFQEFLLYGDFVIIEVYVFVMISLIIFSRQIIRKMGQKTFLNFISGKYHHPKKENRIFLFLDLKSSTSIAERLGDLQFHRLVSDFFYDITASIILFEGEVYRYVGDEVVVVWELNQGIKNANCVRTHFDAKRRIWKNREKYLEKYGIIPDFRTVLNWGEVFAGEMGDVKSQIVYQGEVLYSTREMEKYSKSFSDDLLISTSLLNKLDLPSIYSTQPRKNLELGENRAPLRLASIRETPA